MAFPSASVLLAQIFLIGDAVLVHDKGHQRQSAGLFSAKSFLKSAKLEEMVLNTISNSPGVDLRSSSIFRWVNCQVFGIPRTVLTLVGHEIRIKA
jgi:hypothetical protein